MVDRLELPAGAGLIKRCRLFASVTSAIVICAGASALLGWTLHIEFFTRLHPNFVAMKFNTAVCFILLGLSLWFSRSDSTSHAKRLWARYLSLTVVLIGSLSLVEWLSGRSFGIDQLLFYEHSLTVDSSVPGRMAAATALDFALLGVALSWLDAKWPRGRWLSEWLAAAAAIIALLAFIEYFYNFGSPHKIPGYSVIALDTVICFLLLSMGVLCVRPNRGLAAALTDTRAGSVLARRLLPVAVLLPPFMAWLRLLGQRAGYFDPVLGTALFTMAFILILTVLIWRTAGVMNRADEGFLQLSGQLLALQHEERRRLARELHDSTAQNLGVVTLNLARLRGLISATDETSQALITEILSLTEQSLREIRTFSYLLHPPMLDEAGLPTALQWYVDGFIKRSGIPVDLDMPPHMERLPENLETALFRVAQESLTNILRHAKCRRASICLGRDGEKVTLEVHDDGKGFRPNVRRKGEDPTTLGVGIMGMRERLRQLGGSLELESDEHGTTVRAVLHLNGNGPS
jgi:signal transduction histidine kinase